MTTLQMLAQEVSVCMKCPELVANRTQTVFSDGDPKARLMFIGESPGYWEDKKGLPFVGDSGELLNNIIKACGWSRGDIYTTNVLKCKPPNNRNPSQEELCNCHDFLEGQIDLVKPEFIMLFGSVASGSLLGGTVTAMRGRWHSYKGISTLCTHHPARALREGDWVKKEMGSDFRMLMERMHQK